MSNLPFKKMVKTTTANIAGVLRDTILPTGTIISAYLSEDLKEKSSAKAIESIDLINTSELTDQARETVSAPIEEDKNLTKAGLGVISNTVGLMAYGYETYQFLYNLYRVNAWDNLTRGQKFTVGVIAIASATGPGYTLYNWISNDGKDNEKHIMVNAEVNASGTLMMAAAKNFTTLFANHNLAKNKKDDTLYYENDLLVDKAKPEPQKFSL